MKLSVAAFLASSLSRLLCAAEEADSKEKLAAAWMYIADADWCPSGVYAFNYSSVPSYWEEVNYKHVDVLLIGPIGLQSKRQGVTNSTNAKIVNMEVGLVGDSNTFNKTVSWCPDTTDPIQLVDANFGSLENRFTSVLTRARELNPSISVHASIWWTDPSCPNTEWGAGLCAAENYSKSEMMELAESARDFLEMYDLQGLDIDYEDGNVFPSVTDFFEAVNHVFEGKYKLSISPASMDYIETSKQFFDLIFMQTYEGGVTTGGISPSAFIENGFDSEVLFYGLCPETNCDYSPTVVQAIKNVSEYNLAGTHLWRLNSDNYLHEEKQQEDAIYIADETMVSISEALHDLTKHKQGDPPSAACLVSKRYQFTMLVFAAYMYVV